jgi:hypothetical protein
MEKKVLFIFDLIESGTNPNPAPAQDADPDLGLK